MLPSWIECSLECFTITSTGSSFFLSQVKGCKNQAGLHDGKVQIWEPGAGAGSWASPSGGVFHSKVSTRWKDVQILPTSWISQRQSWDQCSPWARLKPRWEEVKSPGFPVRTVSGDPLPHTLHIAHCTLHIVKCTSRTLHRLHTHFTLCSVQVTHCTRRTTLQDFLFTTAVSAARCYPNILTIWNI